MEWDTTKMTRVVVAGAALEARCFGPAPAEAATIVLLHEGLGCVAMWRDFPERLAERTGHGVFAFSREGYGGSDPIRPPRPLDYMTREAVEVLPYVLDAIGLKRGVLLGHSDGASIAALYCGNVQDHRIRGLILMAPHFFTEETGLAAIAAALDAYEDGDLRDRLARHHRDVEGAFHGWNDAWLDPGFRDWDITETIDYVRVPVLAIQGADDEYGTRAQLDVLAERLYSPYDEVFLPACGHAPHLDKPEETLSAIADFMDRLDRIEAAKAERA